MIIIGAKGFAKEVLEVCCENEDLKNLAFYDDISKDVGTDLYGKFKVINNAYDVKKYFSTIDKRFALGLGNPILRYKLKQKFNSYGGQVVSTISRHATIGNFNVKIGEGCNILPTSMISNDVSIGECCILYFNSVISHDCRIGDYVEISPCATILGRATIGNFSQIGANSTILPDVTIGKNVIIGAGAVVTKNIPDHSLAVGVPAKVVKQL